MPSSPSHSAESSTSSRRQPPDSSDSKGLLVLIPDRIDVEEEARFYDDIVDVSLTIPCASHFSVHSVIAAVILTADRIRNVNRARVLRGKTVIPTVSRIRLLSRLSRRDPYSRTTYGWGITAERARLLPGPWKFLGGRVWEISAVARMSVRSLRLSSHLIRTS